MPDQTPAPDQASRFDPKRAESISKIVLASLAVLGFLWGVFQYFDARAKQAETQRIEATRPYLERQLQLYVEATQVAAQIATASRPESEPEAGELSAESLDGTSGKSAGQTESGSPEQAAPTTGQPPIARDPVARFWELYWGELALVEDWRVETAMAAFGDALQGEADSATLQQLSLDLAHACRDSLAESWGVEHWQTPRPPSSGRADDN